MTVPTQFLERGSHLMCKIRGSTRSWRGCARGVRQCAAERGQEPEETEGDGRLWGEGWHRVRVLIDEGCGLGKAGGCFCVKSLWGAARKTIFDLEDLGI
jgi:hypothetical protein